MRRAKNETVRQRHGVPAPARRIFGLLLRRDLLNLPPDGTQIDIWKEIDHAVAARQHDGIIGPRPDGGLDFNAAFD